MKVLRLYFSNIHTADRLSRYITFTFQIAEPNVFKQAP